MSCEPKEHATSEQGHLNTTVIPSKSLSPLSLHSLFLSLPSSNLSLSLSLCPKTTNKVQDGGYFIFLGSSECCVIKKSVWPWFLLLEEVLVTQLFLTLCDSTRILCHGIFQARILEWVPERYPLKPWSCFSDKSGFVIHLKVYVVKVTLVEPIDRF